MRAKFITVEGTEGVGKSTQIARMRDFLEAAGKPVTVTREPGGTALGERLRALLLAEEAPEMDPDAELLLMFAARAEHLSVIVRPALAAGHWVLCDRFTDASYAYQGGGRGLPRERIAALEQWLQGELRPDRTFLLDAPVSLGLRRVAQRGTANRFDRAGLAFLDRVRKSYLQQADTAAERFVIVDARAPIGEVTARIIQSLEDLL